MSPGCRRQRLNRQWHSPSSDHAVVVVPNILPSPSSEYFFIDCTSACCRHRLKLLCQHYRLIDIVATCCHHYHLNSLSSSLCHHLTVLSSSLSVKWLGWRQPSFLSLTKETKERRRLGHVDVSCVCFFCLLR